MNPRSRATLSAIRVPRHVGPITLAVLALACFVVAAWGVDWRLGLVVLGLSLLVLEWRIAE